MTFVYPSDRLLNGEEAALRRQQLVLSGDVHLWKNRCHEMSPLEQLNAIRFRHLSLHLSVSMISGILSTRRFWKRFGIEVNVQGGFHDVIMTATRCIFGRNNLLLTIPEKVPLP